jgi:hypothetical protein
MIRMILYLCGRPSRDSYWNLLMKNTGQALLVTSSFKIRSTKIYKPSPPHPPATDGAYIRLIPLTEWGLFCFFCIPHLLSFPLLAVLTDSTKSRPGEKETRDKYSSITLLVEESFLLLLCVLCVKVLFCFNLLLIWKMLKWVFQHSSNETPGCNYQDTVPTSSPWKKTDDTSTSILRNPLSLISSVPHT